jgi:2'-5' RNA ligase
MRLFIASRFSASSLERIREIRAFAKPLFGNSVKWVKTENIHLTYAFLGEVESEPKLSGIRRCMDAAAGAFRKAGVTLGGFGRFPLPPADPTVLWLGLKEGSDNLSALALNLTGGLGREGFVFERVFTAHVTIARAKTRLNGEALKSVAGKAEALEARDTVASLLLMQSELSGAGPEYRVIYSSELL